MRSVTGDLPEAAALLFETLRERHRTTDASHRPWKIGDPIVEPQGAYRLPNGQLVLSRECS
ncbi:hypothetical protein [Gloeocapsopsis sp. IPPAS B-1203]|uniref:hypothetical protein n=1 Tax=Gloeocapsopsis sp. IPPAS B-1203 TaxID=2049454 RepID=UPI000C193C3E|nr:hypothetical protein [Gloeocapsopsis sp. IPPAS B-1203]PIG94620.1 hypothetical protein CSQ79_04910 [Gloeocapsopsis sp. IPPAS B-1203]